MNNAILDAAQFREMLCNGYRNLKQNMSVIDDLNVFPVPDGDTGKNMTMTIEGGVAGTNGEFESIGTMMQQFSRSCLLAARGNSGVILSQFIRGLAIGSQSVVEHTVASFTEAFSCGVDYAYKAVATPVEGTMLTVLREGGEFLSRTAFSDFTDCFTQLLAQLNRSLQRTPDLLPVLKEAGVVDSGGAGLVCIIDGMRMYLNGERIDESEAHVTASFAPAGTFDENSSLEYGYCTEFILQLLHAKTNIELFSLADMTTALQNMGDSVVTVQDGSLIKVHVHTFNPEKVLAYARLFGEFVTIKMENMSVQHSEVQNKRPEKQKYAIVSTATGDGMIRFFKEVGVNEIVNGGRTNNPSAEAFLDAFRKVNADHILVLPNDSNVILTANQAASLYEEADVRVLPTHSLAEGFSALSMMDTTADTVEQLIGDMTAGLDNVTTGYVTTATRDALLNGVSITKGDWMGLEKDTVYAATDNPLDAALALFAALPDMDDKQVVTAFCGKDVTEGEKNALEEAFVQNYPLTEIGFIDGGQDVYRYIFAIE